MDMGQRRDSEIDSESVEDDFESDEGNEGHGDLEWEYESDVGEEDDGLEEGGQESSGDSSYSPSTGSMMEVDTWNCSLHRERQTCKTVRLFVERISIHSFAFHRHRWNHHTLCNAPYKPHLTFFRRR